MALRAERRAVSKSSSGASPTCRWIPLSSASPHSFAIVLRCNLTSRAARCEVSSVGQPEASDMYLSKYSWAASHSASQSSPSSSMLRSNTSRDGSYSIALDGCNFAISIACSEARKRGSTSKETLRYTVWYVEASSPDTDTSAVDDVPSFHCLSACFSCSLSRAVTAISSGAPALMCESKMVSPSALACASPAVTAASNSLTRTMKATFSFDSSASVNDLRYDSRQ
mmetsp:Transcript_33484/g.99649  ORF Transcript_33484/g.99649 Transcript_33484/m.99649 type:complete len:226 (-) Transcript_33484:171-848(-)